jgi:hypothetical protein
MSKSNKENTLIIMAASGGFPFEEYSAEGYRTIPAYKPTNLFTRLLREVCFRLPLLPKVIWYNPAVLEKPTEFIYIRDAIITKHYLLWLQKNYPKAQINFVYENLIGRARHLRPNEIPKGIRIWTFDSGDAERYHIRLKKVMAYFTSCLKPAKEKKYDLLFVGRDKGRGDWLKGLEEYLQSQGIKTKFHIVQDGRFSRKKPYYEKPVSYNQLTDWVGESRALLNVCMENQKGITLRDLEAYFNQIKLVTTNLNISDTEIYDPSNTFVLTENNFKELVDFLKRDYVRTHELSWENHRIEDYIAEITV